MGTSRSRNLAKVIGILVGAIIFLLGLIFFFVEQIDASLVTIDNTVSTTAALHPLSAPAVVFTSELVGYTFYVNSTGSCVYSKTIDGGANWGAEVNVDPQTDCLRISVWYDRWTPGDTTGNYIHVATIDGSDDDIFYRRIDTSDDTQSTIINITSGSTYVGVLVNTANQVSITKATDGRLMAATMDASDSIVVTCTTTCTTATNWSETSPNFLIGDDYPLLVPRLSGEIMLIMWDTSNDDLVYWQYTGSWTSTSTIEFNAADNTTYDAALGAAINKRTGDVYLAVVDDASTLGTDDDIKTWRYTAGAWNATTNAITNSASCAGVANCGLTSAKIAVDEWSGDVYVVYSARSTFNGATTANIRWKRSTDHMVSWGSEQGPLDVTNDDMYGPRLSLNGPRLYAAWVSATPDDIFGDTIHIPTLTLATSSSQAANLTIGGNDQYVGGTFVLTHNTSSTTLTSFSINETGTVDAQNDLDNIKLFYDLDTSSPYDCASESYGGSESQFGSTDTDGFDAVNGTSTFSGALDIATSSAACLYVVLDVGLGATDGETLDIEVTAPQAGIGISRGVLQPLTTRALAGETTLQTDELTQIHYHWRNDDGSETTATSATGGVEDTRYLTYPYNGSKRVRIEVSNEGSLSTTTAYRLEYGSIVTTCDEIATWIDVGAGGGDWDMVNSANLTDGNDTTNIAEATGGVTDENSNFESPNGGLKDTSSQTGNITLSSTDYVELEFSIQAGVSATAGNSYCFRLTNAGTPLSVYSVYPRATILADVLVSSTGTQNASITIPTANAYVGGAFSFIEQTSSRNVTGIEISETGTVDAQLDLDNIRIYYDLDTSAPYDCASESYGGSEPQFGSTDTNGFSSANGTSTFSGSVAISTTQSMCAYVVLDVLSGVVDGETLEIEIATPTTDVTVDGGGTTSPTSPTALTDTTTLQKPILVQQHTHWRNDDGGESSATSATGGVENTILINVHKNSTKRLRVEVSNEGSLASSGDQYTIQYGERITTCGAIASWIDVGASGGAFDMSDSLNLTDGANTTNIAEAIGGVTDENSNFESPNGGVKDTSSETGSIALSSTDFVELEYSIEATDAASYGGTYCFRVVTDSGELSTYSRYGIMTLQTQRDFFVQRGVANIANASSTVTILAGVDYTAPAATSSAFIRITSTQHTGAGHNVGGGTQVPSNVTVRITNPENIQTGITFARIGTTNVTQFNWEIVEYVGPSGGDNEFVVRMASSTAFSTTAIGATTTVAGVVDDADVAVFVTGVTSPDTTQNDWNTSLVTAEWLSATDQMVLSRGEASGDAIRVSWAAIEFIGPNWKVQRASHTYTNAGANETETITSVNDVSRAFLHVQKRAGAGLQGTDEFGHEVWLSAANTVTFALQTGATSPTLQTSVAWIIENTQTTGTPMIVTRDNDTQSGGAEPSAVNYNINTTIADMSTASIFITSRTSGTGTAFPRPNMNARIVSTTQYELWISDTGATNTFRVEVVEWPTAVRTLTQNYYRFYVDNDALDPTDPWPVGVSDLGDNTSITASNDPLSPGERIRMRMSVTVRGANLTASTTAFKLQFGERVTSCNAISSWLDVGEVGSTTAEWRGFDGTPVNGTALSGNPPSGGDLNLIAVSERAGSYVEEGLSPGNPYKVYIGEDVEYDWVVERNTAPDFTTYCFRMVEYNGTPLSAYSFHPTLITSGFLVETQNWRWYDDENNETPLTALASENVAPSNIAFDNTLKLRVTALESGGGRGANVKFKLQFSEVSDFSSGVVDVEELGSCSTTSLWCYDDGGGLDNATSSSKVLSDSDSCSAGVGDGCGTHNESGTSLSTFIQEPNTATEYEFTIRHAGARVNVVYFFRLYDVVNDVAVDTGGTYPSLTTEGAALSFSVSGLSTGSVTEGVTTDVTTTATAVPFGALAAATETEAAQRLTVTTNATAGYRIFAFARQGLLSGATEIAPVTGTNAAPSAWGTGCTGVGCYGYHAGDDVLGSGTTARFSPNDTYAQFTSSLAEVAYSATPVSSETTDIVYKVEIDIEQPGGQYSTNVVFIAVPVF